MNAVDLSVYLVTDRGLSGVRGVRDVVLAAARGGATMVQLRDPEAKTRTLVVEARALAGLLRPHRIPLIVNDRVDVALAADADGVHVGLVDYLGVGPVFATPTKVDAAPPMGMAGLKRIAARTGLPIVAIGGLHAGNAADAIAAGAAGVSVVSAICAAPDPELATRELAEIVRAARAGRA
ncbi:MAG: thiamine phosphate synthase [Rhizobiales bacterium]|nr:thiamine phosphate synthase [Hyphomicrobiales bacterium]